MAVRAGRFAAVAGAFVLAVTATGALGQAYPAKPVRLIVPFPPGGGTSYVAQLVGEGLGKLWGQNVLVDNRPGGNTLIGTLAVYKSPADGYTLLFMTSAHVINEFVTRDMPFSPVKDFTPITTLTVNSYGMVVHPSLPARTLKEFIALARAKPGQLNGGTVGEGGPTHLAVQLLNMVADIRTQPVPYKGTGPLMPDMLSGRLDFTFNNLKTLVPVIKAGKLRALGVAASTRSQLLPELNTLSEAGLPGFTAGNWYGVIAPKGTARPIVTRVAADLRTVMDTPRLQEAMENDGMELFMSANPEEFQQLLQTESEKFGKLIRSTAGS